MEHEVFVPVPVGRLREALADPERVARAVPGLQQDAGTPPVAGRLKVRVAGHTITYRGTLRVAPQEDGSYLVEGDAAEARGSGTVKLTLTLRLLPGAEGTTLACSGTATATGRITELPADQVTSAATRLLSRFAENLPTGPDPEPKPTAPSRTEPQAPTEPEAAADEEPSTSASPSASTSGEDEPSASVFETEVPPSALDPFGEGGLVAGEEPPAEAAHARRTMIGRSAEEVDHAPPRGRYAPVPAPEPVSASATLRWAAPAAALAVASAIIVSRALRKRR
ncbi:MULTISPECIES: SRPBCC domain-containing protein [unclassified Streptomyces]|uniref:SRPBCC domain-containing protein n=1 Tax=unclassified Streptomyces TaxID=2593676 RepID=UPI002E7737F5|nr:MULTISPECIES: SRPBCC domain-containing protein [unclassified Streptomyces]MEE1763802.1 SRPBCC domain-containing protein [Streptomyces sp. SP18BB07]MEE1834994.1 SRPBCC domain-containing protein [Streptomyces sp. SP17KL33]